MKLKLPNKRLLAVILVLIVAVGFGIWRKGVIERIIPSKVEEQAKETVFVHASKQFAITVPTKWSIAEPVGGKQTYIYPSGVQLSATDIQTLIDQDVIIIETAVNKKESFDALITEMKTAAEKAGSTVTVEAKDYGVLKASNLTVQGKTSYQQTLFNTPTVIILTAKIDHSIFGDLAKSVTIDLSGYANDIAQVTNLTRQTKQDLAAGKFADIYKASSENLKKLKKEDEFGNMLKDVSAEFNNNVLIWGIFINSNGLGSAINIINQDKVTRRGSFYYAKDGDKYLLDGLRISGKISYNKAKTTDTSTTKTKK